LKDWIYEIEKDNTIRYALGIVGENPLICIGINPSTAEPTSLDPTIKRVENIAFSNGYDSWIMFNVYPKRDTNFQDLHLSCNDKLHIKNINIIKKYLGNISNPTIWVAFGDHIYHRNYLIPCLKEIYAQLKNTKISWVTVGINKSGAPKHPLYQKNDSALKKFDMDAYISSLGASG
jgi:hypothetical protein